MSDRLSAFRGYPLTMPERIEIQRAHFSAQNPSPSPPAFKPGQMVRLGLYFFEVVSYSPKARRVRYRKLSHEKVRVQHMLRRVFEKTAVPA